MTTYIIYITIFTIILLTFAIKGLAVTLYELSNFIEMVAHYLTKALRHAAEQAINSELRAMEHARQRKPQGEER